MAFWDKAKRFLTDIFYEEENAVVKKSNINTEVVNTLDNSYNQSVNSDVSAVSSSEIDTVLTETVENKDNVNLKTNNLNKNEINLETTLGQEHTVLKGVLSDFFEGYTLVENKLSPVSYELQKVESQRVKAISRMIAEKNDLEECAVWTETGGNTRIRKNMADKISTDIIFNAAFTSKLDDNQLAFVIGRQYARINCFHMEEEKLLNECFEEADLTLYYRFRISAAVHRNNVFEADKYGLQFASKAGFEVPKDLEFLRMDENIFGFPPKGYSVLTHDPTVTERQIVLDSDGTDFKPFNKKEHKEYIKFISKAIEARNKHLYNVHYPDGKYVHLNSEEYFKAINSAAEIEDVIIKRFMPNLQEQNAKIKDWLVTHIPVISEVYPKPLKFKKVRDLHFDMDVVKNTPARLAFEKEVMDMLKFVKQGVDEDENKAGGRVIYFKNLQNLFSRNKKVKKNLSRSPYTVKKSGDMTDSDNTGR